MEINQEIQQASDGFYAALNVLFTGDEAPMRDVWSHDEDVVYMGPDGLFLIGWNDVAQMWSSVAKMKLGGHVKPDQIHTIAGSDMALINCVEVGQNEINGKQETVSIRSSTTLHKRDGLWKVVAHQTDLLSYMS
jgi:ketosteroid isomerase-like protein